MNVHIPTFHQRSLSVRAVPGWVLAAAAAAGVAWHPLANAADGSTASTDSSMSGPSAMTGMAGLYGPYELTREGSGTAWQPDSTPMSGLHGARGAWMGMVHGFVNLIYDDQGGARGDTQTFSSSMLMLVARRELANGALGLRFMVSGDPAMGKEGYPLLFQTGETADGRTPLIDRQHPHDLLMEAAASYSVNLSASGSAFLYVGLPGEPALGPNAYMHRLSGMDNPEAPLTHHWMDSTHISWGVVTGGLTWADLKLEASAFNGREPDENRYNIEVRPLDSWAARVSYNPGPAWALQASYGYLASPEQLEPNVSVRRTTASASYNAPLALAWQTTLAWGRNEPSSGPPSNGWLLESQVRLTPMHTVFARLERVGKDELFLPGTALFGRTFIVNKLSVGYICDFVHWDALNLGLGGLISTYSYPAELNASYGYRPTSFMVFVRARL
jgi:hypothetical protein